MKTILALLLVLAATPVLAANADHPNSNVDPKLDKGGDTGDSKVDALNKGQTGAGPANQTTVTPASPAPTGAPTLGAPLQPAPTAKP